MDLFILDLFDNAGNHLDHFNSTILPNSGDVIRVPTNDKQYLVTRRVFDVVDGTMSVVHCRIIVM